MKRSTRRRTDQAEVVVIARVVEGVKAIEIGDKEDEVEEVEDKKQEEGKTMEVELLTYG